MTLASARLKASVRFPPLRGMYQRGGTCKGCDIATAGTGFAERNLHDLELLESLVSQYARGFLYCP